jgi:lipid-binding SYLF domain-containing protein
MNQGGRIMTIKQGVPLRAVGAAILLGAVSCGAPSREASSSTQLTSAEMDGDARTRDRLNEAAEVIRDVGLQVPIGVAERARCVAVIPATISGGFIVGAEHGNGFALCRSGQGWSAPAPVMISGGSIGLQAGLQASDLVLLFTTNDAMDRLVRGKFQLGVDASAAAGPLGGAREAATDATCRTAVLTYARSRGLFAGVDFGGAVVQEDAKTARGLYGAAVDLHGLLASPLPIPPGASGLVDALRVTLR